MSAHRETTIDPLSATERAESDLGAPAATALERVTQPYLKAFGPDIGVVEQVLTDQPIAIGRADASDMLLPDQRVSRAHARVTFEGGQYVLEDVGSSSGTIVNRTSVERHVLSHGDRVQIGPYVLEFRTHPAQPGAQAAAARAKRMLQADYSVLPSGIRLRYRTTGTMPDAIFRTGDTLRIGQGGLLVPADTPPGDCMCLEVELAWARGKTKSYLGEVVGVIQEEGVDWMCVKLHTVSKQTYASTVDEAEAGPWVEVRPT